MLRIEFLASAIATLGLRKLFPWLRRPRAQGEIYDVTWDADGPGIETMTVTLEYWDGDRWVAAGSGPADSEGFTALLPDGFDGDFRFRYSMAKEPVTVGDWEVTQGRGFQGVFRSSENHAD